MPPLPGNKPLGRDYEGIMVVNKPLIRVPLDCHEKSSTLTSRRKTFIPSNLTTVGQANHQNEIVYPGIVNQNNSITSKSWHFSV